MNIFKSKAFKISLLIGLPLLAVFFAGSYYLFLNLDIGNEPVESDVIIVAEGSVPDRAYKGVELLNEGYSKSDKLVVSPGTGWNLPFYTNAGADKDQLIVEENATSTWTNATNTIEIMEENEWDSAIIVTTDFHTRRTRLSFERASLTLGKDMDFTYVSSYMNHKGEPTSYLDFDLGKYNGRRDTLKYYGYLLGLYNVIDWDS